MKHSQTTDADVMGNTSRYEPDMSGNDGHHGPDWWHGQYDHMNNADRFKQVLSIPEVGNMADVFARAVFKSEKQRNAVVKLFYRHVKFNDKEHQELLRAWCAGSIGMNGRGRLEGTFSTINLLAPDMYRAMLGMPKAKRGEEERVSKGSDFREDGKPPSGGLGGR